MSPALPSAVAALWLLGQVDAGVSRELAERTMRETPQAELIGIGRQAVHDLGEYRYRMAKRERVKGKLLDAQQIDVFVQESPFAVRLHFVGGPSTGRKVLYNEKARPDDFRVREAGLFSVFGALWISTASGLAKSDSNHTVKEAGMGHLLDRFADDLKKAEALGGMKITHEAWNDKGHWCTVYEAPNHGAGFAAAKSRICTDTDTRLPAKIEAYDRDSNLTESYVFSDVRSEKQAKDFFDPKAF